MKTIEKYKCRYLIIGASYAGSLLAEKLAKYDKTIFVDKYIVGTWMNCGGGIPKKTLNALNINIPYTEINNVTVNLFGKKTHFPCNYVVVDRNKLDIALYQKACESGAVFKQLNYRKHNSALKTATLKDKDNMVEISYDKIILANGLHIGKNELNNKHLVKSYARARTEIIDTPSSYPNNFYLTISNDNLLGYSWIFPMPNNKINIGTGNFSAMSAPIPSLEKFKQSENINYKIIKKGGGILPVAPAWKVQNGDTFLFGDSAGMVFPLSGEGLKHIHNMSIKWTKAIVSGKNLNFKWRTSLTYYKMLFGSKILNIFTILIKIFGKPVYLIPCKFAIWIRRTFPNSWFPML